MPFLSFRAVCTALVWCVVSGVVSAQPVASAPDAAPAPQPWTLMQDGRFDLLFNHQAGPRGGDEARATNWWMGMASRRVGGGSDHIALSAMLSLEPATAGRAGYGEIFQVGETLDGKANIDRQHPHDLFMQIGAAWRHALTDRTSLTVVGGPAGEPALGPVAFMHRASAAAIPFAPLSHHVFDATHISFGVATAVVSHGRWTAEGSVFNGREPDDQRWDFDFGPMDSFSGRLWFHPTPSWSLQVSSGRLADLETTHPGNAVRTTASASWLTNYPQLSAVTVGYGINAADANRQGAFAEASTVRFRSLLSARLEVTQVETSVLLGETPGHAEQLDTVTALTLGGVRRIGRWGSIEAGLGGNLTTYVVPPALRDSHGTGLVSWQLFFEIRPVAGAMGRMWEMRMSNPMMH